jgi:MoxR-like ATPase
MTTKRLDARDGQVYVLPRTDPLWLAVRIAKTTGRPLLLRGEPGTGKSSLAAKVALDEKWRYYEHTITPRTNVTDLLWTFDSARWSAKVSSADTANFEDYEFVEPGPLWWAFDRHQARFRGQPRRRARDAFRNDEAEEPSRELNSERLDDGAVVLIDDIDKANADVPNGLLEALGSGKFRVDETGTDVELTDDMNVLVVITTNNERDLPPAFERRCIVHELTHPGTDQLVAIAVAHAKHEGRSLSKTKKERIRRIAEKVTELQAEAHTKKLRAPGIAEFLDAVWACLDMGIDPDGPQWESVQSMTLAKDHGWDQPATQPKEASRRRRAPVDQSASTESPPNPAPTPSTSEPTSPTHH